MDRAEGKRNPEKRKGDEQSRDRDGVRRENGEMEKYGVDEWGNDEWAERERQMGELSSYGEERVSGRVRDGDDYDTHAHPGKQ